MRRGLPEVGETIASKYLVTGLLGRGGMGAVYVVEHRLTGKRLAVKCLLPEHRERPEFVERFLREAQAAGRIQSRYVVDVFDVGRDGELLYIVMEFLEGKPLSELLRDATLPLEDLLAILVRSMEGVAAAHAQSIVHRDLKPENIIVCAGHSGKLDDPRVLDFGISKLEEDASGPLTRSGVMMGTPYYMSFEQISSQRDLDQRVDVYAMGVILYEALSGRVPYVAESVGALAVRMLTVPPEPLAKLRPDLPPELVEVVMRSIARDRDERYPNMRALMDALAPFAQKEGAFGAERTGKLASAANSLRLSGEEPTLLVTPVRTEPRVSTPVQAGAAGEGKLRVFDDDREDPRPSARSEPLALPANRLWIGGGALLLLILLTVLLWPGGEEPAPAEAPTTGASEQRVVVPEPSHALAPPPAAPAQGEARGSAREQNLEPPSDPALEQALPADAPPAAALAVPDELSSEKHKGSARRRRGVDSRTLDQMVPQALPVPAEEREPPPAAPEVKPAPAATVESKPAPPQAELKTEPLPEAKPEPPPAEPKSEPAPAP
jgi:serine/threonine-protein kinase